MKEFDRLAFEQGHKVWQDCRATGHSVLKTWERYCEAGPPSSESEDQAIFRMFAWASWADSGYPIIQIEDPKYASALMATSVSAEAAGDIEASWSSFLIKIPEDLLVGTRGEFNRIWISPSAAPLHMVRESVRHELRGLSRSCVSMQLLDANSGLGTVAFATSLPDLLFGEEWVRDYVSGGRGRPPSVQSLVRGHYKRQVIGISRASRKVVWIEPYWRGPEDAPILARPYKVGPSEAKAPA